MVADVAAGTLHKHMIDALRPKRSEMGRSSRDSGLRRREDRAGPFQPTLQPHPLVQGGAGPGDP